MFVRYQHGPATRIFLTFYRVNGQIWIKLFIQNNPAYKSNLLHCSSCYYNGY